MLLYYTFEDHIISIYLLNKKNLESGLYFRKKIGCGLFFFFFFKACGPFFLNNVVPQCSVYVIFWSQVPYLSQLD